MVTCRYLVNLESLYGMLPPFLGPPRAIRTFGSPWTLEKQDIKYHMCLYNFFVNLFGKCSMPNSHNIVTEDTMMLCVSKQVRTNTFFHKIVQQNIMYTIKHFNERQWCI